MKSKERTRKIISLILALFLMFGILVLSGVAMLQFSVLRPAFLIKQIDLSDYTANIKKDLENTIISYGLSSGIDEDFFEEFLSEDDMRTDICLEAEGLYNPENPSVDAEIFNVTLIEALRQYVIDHGEMISPEMDEALVYLADICTEAYIERIEIPFDGVLSSLFASLKTLTRNMLIGGGILILIVSVFLLAIHPRKSRAVPYFVYALSASAIFLIAISLLVCYSDRIDRIGIGSKSLYYLVINYLHNMFAPLLWIAVCFLVVSISASFIYTFKRK
jgi:hypothetical protein